MWYIGIISRSMNFRIYSVLLIFLWGRTATSQLTFVISKAVALFSGTTRDGVRFFSTFDGEKFIPKMLLILNIAQCGSVSTGFAFVWLRSRSALCVNAILKKFGDKILVNWKLKINRMFSTFHKEWSKAKDYQALQSKCERNGTPFCSLYPTSSQKSDISKAW